MVRIGLAAAVVALLMSCSQGSPIHSEAAGEYRLLVFEVDETEWRIFAHRRTAWLPGGSGSFGNLAEVAGEIVLDEASGCVYLARKDAPILYPVVWPSGTSLTADGVRLRDGSVISTSIAGGGGFLKQPEVTSRCPGENNEHGEIAVLNNSLDELGR